MLLTFVIVTRANKSFVIVAKKVIIISNPTKANINLGKAFLFIWHYCFFTCALKTRTSNEHSILRNEIRLWNIYLLLMSELIKNLWKKSNNWKVLICSVTMIHEVISECWVSRSSSKQYRGGFHKNVLKWGMKIAWSVS